MGVETLATLTASVYRETMGRATIPEIHKDINDAIDMVGQSTSWEFLLKQSNINTNPTYTTGLVSGLNGGTTINLVGGTWDTSWKYKWLYFGQQFTTIQIQSFNSPTQATLATPLNFGANLVGVTYTMFQDIYPVPSDMSYGRDLLILNMQYQIKLFKPYRSTAEAQSIYTRFWFNNYQWLYVDAGTDETTNQPLIKFFPIPSTPQIYPIIYYRQMPYLTQDNDTTVLPREFDEAIVRLATSATLRRYRMQGWAEFKMEGAKMVRDLRKIIRTSAAYDLYTQAQSWPYRKDSSITDELAIIGPIPG